MITHAPLIHAIITPHERACQRRATSASREADYIDETLVDVLGSLVKDTPTDSAWVRALRILLAMDDPLPLDILARREYPLMAVRLDAIVALPNLETLDSAAQVSSILDEAIAVGAPAYNRGDARGCAIVYWATALTIALAPTVRGFAGQTRVTKILRQAVDDPIAMNAGYIQLAEDYAWHMRHALDEVLALLE